MKTVLYVDDNDEILEIIGMLLEGTDYQLLTVNDSGKAVAMCLEKTPDLVLMDIKMPGMNGFEVTKKLRSSGFNNPIVVLTASESDEDRKQAKASGCTDYILKTVDMRNVRSIIDQYIGEVGKLID
jgi:CheY-like chemotaxis protein